MNLPELHATLARLGLSLPDPRSGVVIATDPPRIVRRGDRGVDDVETFSSEDALCRYLLVGMLLVNPVAVADVASDAPRGRPRLPAVKPPKTGFWERIRQQSAGNLAPTLTWSRPLPVHTGIAARGQGLLLLTDTGALVEHGPDGALQLTAVDIVTGAEVWSRPIWPPASTRTVAILRGHTVLGSGATVSVLATATGDLVWSRELDTLLPGAVVTAADGRPLPVRVLAYDPNEAGAEGAGPVALLEVGRSAVGTGLLAAVDLTDGRVRWTGSDVVSDPVYAHPVAPAAARLLRADLDGDRLTLTAVRLLDRTETLVASVTVPKSYAGGRPFVVADELDPAAASGLAVLRFSRAPGPGEVGTRLGDVVLAPGRDTPVFASAELSAGDLPGNAVPRELTTTLGADRFVVTDGRHSRLMRDDGSICWSAPPGDWFRRFESITIHWPRSQKVEAISDDGAVAWSGKTGTPILVHGRALWLMTPARLEGLDVVSGTTHWRRDLRAGEVRPVPNGTVGWSGADESVVVLTAGRLEVHRLT